MRKTYLFAAAVAVGMLTASTTARAGFTVTLDSTTPAGPNFSFNYSAAIPLGDQISAGNFFRIYDFAGLVGTPTVPAGWTVSVANSNPTPPPDVILTKGDLPTVPNLTFTYTGTNLVGPIVVTGFSAVSTLGNFGQLKDFVGRASKSTGLPGTNVDSIGTVIVPGAVPEPQAVISMAVGLTFLIGLSLRRHLSRNPVG